MENSEVALKVIDKIDGRLSELAAKLSSLVTEYGPEAMSLTMDTVRLAGLGPLIVGFILLCILPISTYFLVKFAKLAGKASYSEDGPYIFGVVACGVVTFVSAAVQTFTTFYFWHYVAVFYPEAYLAHKVLGL